MLARLSAQLGDDAYAFVSEPHGRVAVVLICAADAAVGDLDDCFRGAGCARPAGGDDVAGFGTFEDGKGCCHCGCRLKDSSSLVVRGFGRCGRVFLVVLYVRLN